jgi:hypothetical protein
MPVFVADLNLIAGADTVPPEAKTALLFPSKVKLIIFFSKKVQVYILGKR